MDGSCQILQPLDQLCLADALWGLEMHLGAVHETSKLRFEIGKEGEDSWKRALSKIIQNRMRNRCWHGIRGVARYTASAGSWQANPAPTPQLCKTHQHDQQ